MSKEEILYNAISQDMISNGEKVSMSLQDISDNKEFNILLAAMQSYADQEKEKVAVEFAKWKDENTTKDENGCFVIWYRNADTFSYNYSDLYQYFITNVYNK